MAKQTQSVEELFGAALDLPPEERSAFLDRACLYDPKIRASVDALLLEHQNAGGFLSHALVTMPESAAPPAEPATGFVLKPGATLGRYRIVEHLGSGGMGAVYSARDEKLERLVAIKLLAPGLVTGEAARRQFRREALALAKVSHPNIAVVYDVGEQDGIDYIVMECVPGESLAALLQNGSLPVARATSIALQVAGALEEAHEHGVVHRDLKPGNVMITPKGQVKVLDFGLAKLLTTQAADVTVSMMQTRGIVGTPLYMSPEQAQGKEVDGRTDVWSLGVIYYELLTGRAPFQADSVVAVLRAILDRVPVPLRELCPEAPPLAAKLVSRSLEKAAEDRYPSAQAFAQDSLELLSRISNNALAPVKAARRLTRTVIASAAAILLVAAAAAIWIYQRSSERHWALEDAIPQITSLLDAKQPLAASLVLARAQKDLPSNSRLQKIAEENTTLVTVTSSPTNAKVAIQDYVAPNSPWHTLGVTPLQQIRIPTGYFRWKVCRPSGGELLTAPPTDAAMHFALDPPQPAPAGMVYVPGGNWEQIIDFIGIVGPYTLPPYFIDRYEVTNREYQEFVNSGGYNKKEYWPPSFAQDGKDLTWAEATALFRDTTGRPGPSTWAAGHYPEGKDDYPVSGVSWYEASAYAAYRRKSLPVLPQWYDAAPPDQVAYLIQTSNIAGNAPAPVGKYQGLGPYGTYDMAGNVREWVANSSNDDRRFILGGSWRSQPYLASEPETLPPFDRSPENGIRCVRNLAPLPEKATDTITHQRRDFTHFKPASDTVFDAYKLLYAYPDAPLHTTLDGVVKETTDWREEKVTFDTAYRGERMSAYLFLPKNVRPPYQTVLFFPSARVLSEVSNDNGRNLGDTAFFDYIIQSGRAVMYPIYDDIYERRVNYYLPSGDQSMEITTDWYKDAARSLDYLATRHDIDSTRLAYLGVSMGSAEGVIISTLMQDRLKTAVLLDGGLFPQQPPPGGDQADFAPRMKKPVLMVNGRYDFVFSLEEAQNPLFALLGTPPADKRHVLLDTPHDVTEQRPLLVKTVLDWLDHYLGHVNE